MTLLYSVLPFLGMLVFLIVAHEMGHFVTAKLFKIKVLEAGLGYPPRAWGFTWRGTIYSVNWLPLGGFVRLLGEEDPSDPESLAAAPAWKRLIVLGSGAGVNFVLPILLFAIAFMIPREVPAGPAVISGVIPNSPAQQAGLKSGDIIEEVNGRSVKNSLEAIHDTRLNQGEDVKFKIKRADANGGSQTLTISAYARWDPPGISHTVVAGETPDSVSKLLGVPSDEVRAAAGVKFLLEKDQVLTVPTDTGPVTYTVRAGDTIETLAQRFNVTRAAIRQAAGLPDPDAPLPVGKEITIPEGPIGIGISNLYSFTDTESYAPWTALGKGWTATWDSLILARNQVIALFHGGRGPSVAGPVGIAQATGDVVKEAGWKPLLDFAALLSINLAIINFLPLPMVDGGRIAFVLLEIIRRGKRIAPEKEALVHAIGFVMILTLAVVITYFDVLRIIGGGSLFD